MAKVRYEEMLPHEAVEARTKCPVAYLPVGGIEWHGEHNCLGLDTVTGQPFITNSDTSTRLSYDVAAGLGVEIGDSTGLEAGARYLNEIRTAVPESDGSFTTTRPEYVQFYLGVTRRFDWPKGQ